MSDVTADSSNSCTCVVWETTNIFSQSQYTHRGDLASWTDLRLALAYKQQSLEEYARTSFFLASSPTFGKMIS